jgi:hypothetical protein
MELFSPALDAALLGKLAQHVPQRCPVRVFHAEGAGDLPHTRLAPLLGDERDEFILGWRRWIGARMLHFGAGGSRTAGKSDDFTHSTAGLGLACGFLFSRCCRLGLRGRRFLPLGLAGGSVRLRA